MRQSSGAVVVPAEVLQMKRAERVAAARHREAIAGTILEVFEVTR
jgi:hypothetical protein